MNRLSGFLQFIIGFILGVVLLAGASAAVAYVILSKMSSPPDKPLFAEEKKQQALAKKATTTEPNKAATNPVTEVKSLEDIPTGTYKAFVSWSDGLSLRAEPSTEAARLGSLGYKAEIMVLGTSDDGNWQRVKVISTNQEGWIKAGNIEKVQ
ncbi:peptide-binding protein [Aphanothece hegewaldii CCALA 016]|uniref:Peptide-binding protein n=1 Tax=Aphanothece hegewaldii CCALA 016 TaxID=2107694 RepID=A0A2T1M0C1_9CHRO|nr:SH3 domain-containing protein [Aphanothece hegewaldii]PSF38100.1 peptide-binding protein [Aphanothece hegewaldii CCALA 016]